VAGVEDELDAWLAAGLVGLEEVCFLSSVLEDGLLPLLLLEEFELEVEGFVLDLGFLVEELPLNICFIFFMVASFVFFVKKTGGKGARPLAIGDKKGKSSDRAWRGFSPPLRCTTRLYQPFAILFPFEYF
jgi:hypothetical protein